MAAPPSPNYVSDFPADEPHDLDDPQEEFEAEPEEEPKEEPKEAQEMDVDEEEDSDDKANEPELIFPYEGVGSPKPPPPEPDTSSDSKSETATAATVGIVTQVPFTGRRQISIRADIEFLTLKRLREGHQYMDTFDFDLGVEERYSSRVEHIVTTLEDRVQNLEGDENRVDNKRLKWELEEIRLSKDRVERDLYKLRLWAYGFYEGMLRVGAIGERPSEAIDVLAVFGESQPLESQGPPEDSYRANPENTGGSGPANTGGVVAPDVHGCSYKTFLNYKPQSFNETEGVFGLSRWFKKMEQVLEIRKCAEEDKVKFAACTFKGCALIWWNEIQKIEQELWTLTVKGDDIKGYNNRFHELALMCPDLVTPEKNKIEHYIRGLPERLKANVTSSKPASLHDAINMARELIEQAIQAKAIRIGESNKRKRQEAGKAYVTAPAEVKGYAGNLPWCNHCNSHHNGQCPSKFRRCQRSRHQDKDYRARALGVGVKSLQNNPNVVTSTFLLNDHYASILFDSGAEKSFVSTAFTPFIDIAHAALDTSYNVELADGKVV
ncbi:hypothetical protein Tco_0712579 [Tanacetum coccineum]